MIPFIGKTLAFLVAAMIVGGILGLVYYASIGYGRPVSFDFLAGFFVAFVINVAHDVYRSDKFK